MKAVHLIIKGKVQGVFYRASAKEKADALGISGWVKNLPDKNVEALAIGNEAELKAFIEWCTQGPRRAEVQEVSVEERPTENLVGFHIIK
jgi:acylphosphatase